MKFALTVVAGVTLSTGAAALEYKQIAGTWCAPGIGTIQFAPNEIVMNFEKTGERRVLDVDSYRPRDDSLAVRYLASGRPGVLMIGELRTGGTQATLLGPDVPMRNVERCVKTFKVKPNPNP